MKTTILKFQGVTGFTTTSKLERTDIANMTIADELRGTDTIGIHMLFYSQYHSFKHLMIEDFGDWGIYQEGGLQFQFEELSFNRNGAKDPVEKGGSIYIGDMPSGNNSVSTTGFLRNIYMFSGGKYGLKMYRNIGTVIINLIVEYHYHAAYIEQGKTTLYNFYEEENRGGEETVWVHDSSSLFITPHLHGRQPIKETWSGTAFDSRGRTYIDGRDMKARYIEASQVNIGPYSAMTEDKEGGLRRAADGNLEYRNATGWAKLGTSDIRIYEEGTIVPTLPDGAIALVHEV
jgi:hypothetical protein